MLKLQKSNRILLISFTIFLAFLHIYISPAPAFSQGYPAPEPPNKPYHQDIRFEHITRDEGLSHNSVFTIVQDQTGFLWIGTLDGLNRYDGYDFQIYKPDPDNTKSITDRFVRALLVDQLGNIWIATRLGGVNKFDPTSQTFTLYRHDPNDPGSLTPGPVFSLFEDRSGNIWVGTEQGLNRLVPESNEITHFVHDPDDPNSLSHSTVWGMHEDDDGVMWFGTQGGGLNAFDPQSGVFTHYRHDPDEPDGLCDDRVWTIFEDDAGILWLGTQGGLNSFDPSSGSTICYRHDPDDPKSLGNDLIKAIYEDSQGELWVGTWGGGLNILDRQTGEFIRYHHDPSDPTSLANDKIAAVFEDEGGILWVGTFGGGLSKFNRAQQRFVRLYHEPNNPNSLNNNIIYSIFANQKDELWIGTVAGLDQYNPSSGQFVHYLPDTDDPYSLNVGEGIQTVFQDSHGVMWAGSWAEGLNRLDENSGNFIHYRYDPEDPHSLSSDVILSIFEDSNDILWIGTLNGGLNKYDRQADSFSAYRHDPNDTNSLSEDHVHVILEDEAGDFWLGTGAGGLNWFDPDGEHFQHIRHDPNDPQSLSADRVNSIHQDESGTLWIGTPNGLNKLTYVSGDIPQDIVITQYTEKHGLPSDAIQGVLEDEQGYMWISTSRGLARLDPETGSIKTFTTAHGLSSDEFFEGAAVRLRGGEMAFGSSNGLTLFDPTNIIDNAYIPPVAITDFKLLNQSVGVGDESPLKNSIWASDDLQLSHQDRILTFEFSAFSYANSKVNLYQYRLEGFEDDWSPPSNYRTATYTNLDPGDYVFRVRGSNSDGVWNEEGTSLSITITPPWWGTWWFRGLMLFLLAAAVFGVYRWRVRSLEARSRELEEEVASKTRELQAEIGEHEATEARLRQIRDELFTLMAVSRDMVSTLELDTLLDLILEKLKGVVNYDGAAILTIDQEILHFRVYQGVSLGTDLMALEIPVESISLMRRVILDQVPFIIDDVHQNLELAHELKTTTGFDTGSLFGESHSWIGVPMVASDKVIGLMGLTHREPGNYQNDDLNLAQAFANQAAIAIENARLYQDLQKEIIEHEVTEERLRRRRDELATLLDVSRDVISTLELEQLLNKFLQQINQMVGCDGVSIHLLEGNVLKLLTYQYNEKIGVSPPQVLYYQQIPGFTEMLESQKGFVLPDLQAEPALMATFIEHSEEEFNYIPASTRSFAAAPMVIKNRGNGMLAIASADAGIYDQDDLNLLQIFANQLVVAIENARLYEQAQTIAVAEERNRLARDLHDSVTQSIYSASLMAEVLPGMWQRDTNQAEAGLGELRHLTRGALAEMRTMLLELRPETLVKTPLGDLLEQLVEALASRMEIETLVDIQPIPELPPDVHINYYRIAQEALNNIVKHSNASQARVHLDTSPPYLAPQEDGWYGKIELIITDDGKGFDPGKAPPKSLGIGIMSERAAEIGATLRIDSIPEQGTKVRLVWERRNP